MISKLCVGSKANNLSQNVIVVILAIAICYLAACSRLNWITSIMTFPEKQLFVQDHAKFGTV